MLLLFILCLPLILAAIFFCLPSTGAFVTRRDMARYAERTPYTDGERFTYPDEWKTFLLEDNVTASGKEYIPSSRIPVTSPDLSRDLQFSVTWLGHSSVLLSLSGRYILVDPVFCERCSPFKKVGPKRFSRPPVTAAELPSLDAVLLTHDHYDHLDRGTIRALSDKASCFIVPLGVERHLMRWGIDPGRIRVLSWWESTDLDGMTLFCCPSRHFSGRHLVDANRTLFCSWMLRTPSRNIFISGDGSYGLHFREIASRYGKADFAVMECGQYDPRWHPSHLYPEESVAAAADIGASVVLPVHWGAYPLAPHPWDDPITRFTRQADKAGLRVMTPLIGETADPCHPEDFAVHWWEPVE